MIEGQCNSEEETEEVRREGGGREENGDGDGEATPKRYLVVFNVSKVPNIKSLCVSAAAHRFSIILVGDLNEDIERFLCSRIAEGFSMFRIPTLPEVRAFLSSQDVPLVGVEIMESAVSILDASFGRDIAFMPGNEGTGLNKRQKEICDSFVYIPQYGTGTASLNVTVATSIILHEYFIRFDRRLGSL